MDPLKAEFARLVAIMGWNKSEAGRQLGMSHSGINHILNPNKPTRPRPTTLNLLKMMVAAEHPEALEPRAVMESRAKNKEKLTGGNRRGGVELKEIQNLDPTSRRTGMINQMDGGGGYALADSPLKVAVKQLAEIAQDDPEAAKQVQGIITTYWKSRKKRRKEKVEK